MRIIENEEALLSCFREIDREQVRPPRNVRYPMKLESSFSWVEPSGHRVYLLFHRSPLERPVGVAFRRGAPSPEASPKMCEWCRSVQPGHQVGLLSVSVSPRKSVGTYLCRDLNCREKLASSPGINDMRETISSTTREDHFYARVTGFIRRNIF